MQPRPARSTTATAARPGARRPPAAAPAAPAAPPRKRERTRDALMVAAQRLLLEHPAATLSIKQIADAAGVVHATVYNYFTTREELLDAVGVLFFATHAAVLETVTAGLAHSAEVIAASTRQTLGFVLHDPAYGRMLFDAGLPVDRFLAGLRMRLAADVARGVDAGELRVDDRELTLSMVSGSLLGVALDLHRGALGEPAAVAATARTLVALGVPRARAERTAARSYPLVRPPALPLSSLAPRAAFAPLAAAPPRTRRHSP